MVTKLLHLCGRFVFGKLLPERHYPILRGPLRGCKFILRAAAGEAGGVSVHLGRVEPAQTRWLIDLLKPGQVFFDVGANVGYYTLLASRIVGNEGRVVAIEPSRRNVEYLERHLRINRCENVAVMPVACADISGVEEFNAGANCAVGHLSEISNLKSEMSDDGPHPCPLPEYRAREKEATTVVETLTLNALSRRLAVKPNVIKIDVEGAELRVLRGADQLLRTARPHLLLSTHSDTLRDECLKFLAELDYAATPLNRARTEFSASPRT